MLPKPIKPPDREDLQSAREEGWTRDEIADLYGVSVSQVKRWIKLYDLPRPPPRRQARYVKPPKEKEEGEPSMAQGYSLMELCKLRLGKRMGEDHRGYTLDRRPCSSQDLVKAANLEGSVQKRVQSRKR